MERLPSFSNNFKQYFKQDVTNKNSTLASITIDWFPQDPNKEGKAVVEIFLSLGGSITVTWRDKSYQNNQEALYLIEESKKQLLKEYPSLKEKVCKIKVQATWEFEVDAEDFDPEFVDIKGLAIELTQRELEDLLKNQELAADDFSYKIVKE